MKSNLPISTLESALNNMINEGYLSKGSTIEDVEDMAYSCCEGIDWYAKDKLTEWAD